MERCFSLFFGIFHIFADSPREMCVLRGNVDSPREMCVLRGNVDSPRKMCVLRENVDSPRKMCVLRENVDSPRTRWILQTTGGFSVTPARFQEIKKPPLEKEGRRINRKTMVTRFRNPQR